ncbi:hypothetical protein EC30301_5262 [Escherichia coli 3030-1]|nr:hypothetical protein EC30301_5262 [Escherichia coli 3030-1]
MFTVAVRPELLPVKEYSGFVVLQVLRIVTRGCVVANEKPEKKNMDGIMSNLPGRINMTF